MIQIHKKEDCCGCEACAQICPRQCISYNSDSEGFQYPTVDVDRCINCGLCEKVCPMLKKSEVRTLVACYIAYNKNPYIVEHSSSGGIFHALATCILNEGGTIAGARFNDSCKQVFHTFTQDEAELQPLMRSKYIQSRIHNTYNDIKSALAENRRVLFCGTPCQVHALKLSARNWGKALSQKAEEYLFTAEIVCHGVGSSRVWHNYLRDNFGDATIREVNFRDKVEGWKNYNLSISGNDVHYSLRAFDNPFFLLYLRNLISRPACEFCKSKAGNSGADITMGDCWGIERFAPNHENPRGTSIAIAWTRRGESLLQKCNIVLYPASYSIAAKYNSCLIHSVAANPQRPHFWHLYSHDRAAAIATFTAPIRLPWHKRLAGRLLKLKSHFKR